MAEQSTPADGQTPLSADPVPSGDGNAENGPADAIEATAEKAQQDLGVFER